MDHFLFRDGQLHAEDVPVSEIAASVGTPFFCYSAATLTRHYRLFQEALEGTDHLICYAMKANSNLAVVKLLGDLGAGMDVVSMGEYLRAKAAGVPGERIVFSGVGKTRAEMRVALEGGIRQFNVESEPELLALNEVAGSLGVTAPVTVRVNPDVDAKTHHKIATGKAENKFGIPISRAVEVYAEIAALPGLKAIGIDVHIGSQLTDLAPFEAAYTKVADLTRILRAEGHEITRLDLGGGLGIPISRAREVYAEIAALPHIRAVGIDVHIGSQLTDLAPFQAAYAKVADLTATLRADGHDITRLDLGGGLGIPYERSNTAPPLPIEYGAMVKETLGHLGCEIEIEPGRLIAGNAGIMVTQVIYVKRGEDRNFMIVDAAMNDLVRPAMYDAHHDIEPVVEPAPGIEPDRYDIVGPVCETGDTFARGRVMAPVAAGDLVAFRSAGAYGAVMSSEYNSRPLIPEVLVKGDQFAVIRARPSYEEMLKRDSIPEWL